MDLRPPLRHRASRRELLAASDVAATLATWQPEHGRVFQRALALLVDLLKTDFVGCYAPTRSTEGWELEFGHGCLRGGQTHSQEHDIRLRLADIVSGAPGPMCLATVPRAEQNRVVSFREMASPEIWESNAITQLVMPPLGFNKDSHDVRVLCCHRGALLGWCGAYQQEAFTANQRAMFQMVVPTLRSQAIMEKKLGLSELHQQAFLTALEVIPHPAYLLDMSARVVAANAPGRQNLDGRNRTTHANLCEWVRTVRAIPLDGTTRDLPEATLTVINAPGIPSHYLVVQRPHSIELRQRTALVARRWNLTKRQAEILGWVAEGEANKDIACRLACSVRSVEHHVSAILAKAGLRSRSGLVASLLDQ